MAKNLGTTLGERIKRARKANDLTQAELAEQAGVSLRSLQDIEYGKNKNPGVETVLSIAKVLQVTMDGLLGHAEAAEGMPTSLKAAADYLAAFVSAPDEVRCLVMAILPNNPDLLAQTSKAFRRKSTALLEAFLSA